jgi:hypothetical protein
VVMHTYNPSTWGAEIESSMPAWATEPDTVSKKKKKSALVQIVWLHN